MKGAPLKGSSPTVDYVDPASPTMHYTTKNSHGFGIQGHAGCISSAMAGFTTLLQLEVGL